jgi:GAF domain-containing protein
MEDDLLHKAREMLDMLELRAGEPGDLPYTLQHIAQTAQKFFAADIGAIFAINPITRRFVESQIIVGNRIQSNKEAFEQLRSERLVRRIVDQSVLVADNLESLPEYQTPFTRIEAMRSFAGLALYEKYHHKPLGILYLYFKQQRHFTAAGLGLLQFFADRASLLLQETWLLRRYRKVARIGQEINQDISTVDELFEKLQRLVAGILDIRHAFSLAIYHSQTNAIDLYMQEEGKSIYQTNVPLPGAYKQVIETREALFIRHMSREAKNLLFKIVSPPGTKLKESLIFIPLILRDAALGVLSIQHTQPNAYNQDDLFILQLLTVYISLARHNMRLFDRLNQLNKTGQLLTQQLDSQQTLQVAVEKIHEATKADVVVLYPYLAAQHRFAHPPRIAGTLLASSASSMYPSQPDDIISLMLQREKPIYAKPSANVYTELLDNTNARRENFARREKISSTAAMPLRVKDEVVGILFVNFRQPQRFDASQRLFIEGLALYAAIAIKNAQMFDRLSERRERELEILQTIDRELNRTLDLESLLNTLLKLAYEQVPAEEASILLHNRRKLVLEIPAAIGSHAEDRRKQTISLQESKGITGWVLEHKQSARVDNVHSNPKWRDLYITGAPETVSELDVPLLDGGEVVGVLNFESTREAAFSEEDEDFLTTLAGQAVLAITKMQAYEREKRLAQEGQVLNEVSKEITGQLDYVRVFDLILTKALALTTSMLGTLHLHHPGLNTLRLVARHGEVQEEKYDLLEMDRGIVGHVATHKQMLNIGDVTQYPWNDIYLVLFPDVRSQLAVPMLAGDELRGVLSVESPNLDQFTESDERLLQGLADLAVVALQNAERYEQARKEAQRFALWHKAEQELNKIADLIQLEEAYDAIVQIATEHSQSQAIIRRYDKDAQELVMIHSSQPDYAPLFPRQNLDVGPHGQVAREKHTIVIHDTNNPSPEIVPLQLSDPTTRSLLITPIVFKEQYYGNLALTHKDVGHFWGTDITFFEGLAQKLATTIYRLETTRERQEFEQQIRSSEIMSSLGQVSFELTHRWGNDLGLVGAYVDDIRLELAKQAATNPLISRKLDKIVEVTGKVLELSKGLKESLGKPDETVVIPPNVLLEEAQSEVLARLPPLIQIELKVDKDVASVLIFYSLIADTLRNLVTNAIEAMPNGGTIILKAYNYSSRYVALEVIDTGIGIPMEQQTKIFDLSFSTKRSSGFGLWSARTNALKNSGDLKVKSQVGQGTTFTLLLPRVEKGTI